jgi:hypothetical protein
MNRDRLSRHQQSLADNARFAGFSHRAIIHPLSKPVQLQSAKAFQASSFNLNLSTVPIHQPPPPNLQQSKTGLPDKLKTGIETLSGFALDDVRVHYNSSKPRQLQALAYTQGTEIYVSPGQERHLPHEAWHIVQQKQGRVKPTRQIKGAAINDNVDLEREAEVNGTRALQVTRTQVATVNRSLQSPVIQRALTANEAQALRTKAIALNVRLDQLIQRMPDVIGGEINTDEFMDPIREVTNNVQNKADTSDHDELQGKLESAKEAIDSLEDIIKTHQDVFDAMGSVYTAVPARDRSTTFADLDDAIKRLAKRLTERTASAADINAVRLAMERMIIPDNKAMQKLREENAQAAMDKVAILVEAGLAEVSSLDTLYASEYDAGVDQFGGAWKLKPASGSGKLQWLRKWEFHVHASVQRAVNAPNTVTGFTIHRAHIKPSGNKRALGVSIQITNPRVLTGVQNDNQGKIIRWSTTSAGQAILKKIKR